MKLSRIFREFSQSERSGGFVLIGCTVISLILANTGWGRTYADLLHTKIGFAAGGLDLNYTVEHWINDGLMTIFFLLVGLEIERELYVGELSKIKNAILPVIAAVGGMVVPAGIHFMLNVGTPAQPGFGIPMATDIAFALGILSLAGNRVPLSLKIFLTALAIIDDLGAITVIAIFYTKGFSLLYFSLAVGIFLGLFILGKRKVNSLPVYLLFGVVMWYCMLKSGVHATIAGVLLAFAIPFHKVDERNISFRLQLWLHKPVAFIILPIFALANTAIIFPEDIISSFTSGNSLGIMGGLIVGKFIGILGASYLAVKTGVASLSTELSWKLLAGVALLGGIGFTMSIFITNLAFSDPEVITTSKMSILLASVVAGAAGLLLLRNTAIKPAQQISRD